MKNKKLRRSGWVGLNGAGFLCRSVYVAIHFSLPRFGSKTKQALGWAERKEKDLLCDPRLALTFARPQISLERNKSHADTKRNDAEEEEKVTFSLQCLLLELATFS